MKITIKKRFTEEKIFECEAQSVKEAVIEAIDSDADLSGADLIGADLRGADLRDAYLRGAYLRDAYLRGAYLRDAYLRDAKNYSENHDFFYECVRRETADSFTEYEWHIIGLLSIHRLCWDAIKKRFGEKIMPIFERLAETGFDEYRERYKGILND
jgi:hypothetical protein